MTSLRDYRKTVRLEAMDRAQDVEDMVAEFTMGGACWMCGMHEEGTIEYEDGEVLNCPVCNQKENRSEKD